MSQTNKTLHYEFPQYIGTDIPSILTDLNETYEAIDEAMYAIASKQSTDEAQVTALAGQVSTQGVEIAQNTTNLANEISARQSADSALDTRLTTAENNITSEQGSISNLNTRVTALENASVDAEHVSFNDSSAHITASNVQDAIMELDAEGHALVGELQTTTLTTGATSATVNFTQSIISTTIITPVCSIYGVSPTAVTYTEHSMTLTFEAQASDAIVGARIQNVI